MAKKQTHAQLKKKVDEWFSKCIRYRAADSKGYAECFTCHTRHHVGHLHCGHFASRRHMATRWHDPADGIGNTAPQCIACNLYDQGRQWYFGQRIDSLKRGRAAEIMRLAKDNRPYPIAELRELHDRYKREANAISNETPAVLRRPAKTKQDKKDKAKA